MTAGTVSTPLIVPIIPSLTHRAKNHIDTNTPVSIHSDTLGVSIFYTLDGSNPVPAERGSACSSRKYSEPVLLPAGRVSVRAVAVSSDGRRSSTVTKVFSVDSNDTNVVPKHIQSVCPSGGATGSHERPAGSSLRPPELRSVAKRSPPAAPRFLARGLGPGPGPQPGSSQPALSSTNASRVQYETDFMRYEHIRTLAPPRCPQCLSLHPADPFARFCAQCGAAVPLLPEQRLPPAEGGQMIQCAFCKTVVPVNAETCLVCEASIHQQLQPQASLTLQEHVVCVCCGSGNPAHVSSCVTCETHLQTVWASDAPPVPSAARRMLSCARCKRLNHGDARFCDWCGSKSRHAARCVLCWRCGSSGPPSACYCAACGVSLRASRSDDLQRPTQKATPSSDPTPSVKASPLTEDQSTQTVGLYFPSATELHRKHQKEQLRQQVTRDRQLTAISPGRGYWRRQLDHVCAHLRSYAQNNPPFRTLLGEPRLGRVVSAVIQEDQYEASLTISFVSAGREGQQVGPECDAADGLGGARLIETLSSVTEKSAESSSIRNDQSTRLTKPLKPKPAVKDSPLLKELGPGRGQISIIQQLLDQGADPSCCNDNGRHALAVAVGNGHHDVLPLLVQHGANIDLQSGQMKNTALHEAAALGAEGLQCAQVLLSCKASVRCRNAAGQSPYDVAVISGCNDMVSLLAAQTGRDLLTKVGKPKLDLDMF